MPFVVWTMNDGLAAIQGAGASQGPSSCSAIPLKDVVTTGAGWATTSGPATAGAAEGEAAGGGGGGGGAPLERPGRGGGRGGTAEGKDRRWREPFCRGAGVDGERPARRRPAGPRMGERE